MTLSLKTVLGQNCILLALCHWLGNVVSLSSVAVYNTATLNPLKLSPIEAGPNLECKEFA